MSYLVIRVEDTERKRQARFGFERSPVHLGRSELNDFILPLPSISLWHGVVRFDDAAVRYVDSGSRNGTALDGLPVKAHQSVVVETSQQLEIWPLKLQLSVESGGELPDNAGQWEKLFGGGPSESPAAPGQTRFARALQIDPAGRIASGSSAATPDREASACGVWRAPGEVTPSRRSGAKVARVDVDATVVEMAPVTEEPRAPVSAPLGELEEAYGQFRSSAISVQRQLSKLFAGKPEAERRTLIEQLSRRFPQLREVNMLAPWGPRAKSGLAGARGPQAGEAAAADGAGSARDAGLALLEQFAASYVAQRPRLTSEAHAERFLDRVAQVLEAFAKGFIELRRGHESFGDQLGVGAVSRRDARGSPFDSIPRLLEHLLDDAQGDAWVRELTRSYADLMVHQVALIGGVREGVRELLELLSPETIEQLARRKGGGLIGNIVPAQRHWAVFLEQHGELMGDEEHLSQVLFGSAFARAYAAIARGDEGDGAGPADHDERPGRRGTKPGR